MLEAMLVCEMTGPEAHRRAPWLQPAELEGMIAYVETEGRIATAPARLGRLVKLTDDERADHKIYALRPHDVEWEVVQERRRVAKIAYNAARNKRRKAEQRQREASFANGHDLSDRAEQLSLAIGPEWVRVPDLVALVATSDWRGRDGQKLTGNSLVQAVKRALDELAAFKPPKIESEMVAGRRGLDVRRVRKYHDEQRQIRNHDHDKSMPAPNETQKAL